MPGRGGGGGVRWNAGLLAGAKIAEHFRDGVSGHATEQMKTVNLSTLKFVKEHSLLISAKFYPVSHTYVVNYKESSDSN